MAELYNFSYDSTNNWNKLNEKFLSNYNVVIFLDTRPEGRIQREAFKKYMDDGGPFVGFHFAGFALTPSIFPQDWDWYHNLFIGAGNTKAIPGDQPRRFYMLKTARIPLQKICRPLSGHRQMNGIAGKKTFG